MPKPNQPCPCGSGRKYKDCCAGKQAARRRLARRAKSAGIWLGVIAVVGAIVYGLATTSSYAFDEDDLAVIDFSSLNDDQRNTALENANAARCPCGCRLGLAQCVVTDMTCPQRDINIGRIRKMVTEARTSGGAE
jgi:hypothetical protein